jgi:nucleoside phosphorylase
LLAVAADGRELAGFPSREPARLAARWGYWAQWSNGKTLMVADGIGREAAKRAVASALALHELSAIVSIGYVGALRPGWAAGDVFLAERILLLEPRLEYAGTLPVFDGGLASVRRGVLATIDHVAATVAEKRELAALGADAVDMEAFEVARQAEQHGLPFFCVRVISDDADIDLGFDFDRARRPDGTVSGAAVIAQAGLSPERWRRLFALKRNGELAARNLARFLLRCRFPLESNR